MAVGMLLTWSGFTKEQYDRVTDLLDLDRRPQKGSVFHCAGPAAGGWRVFDIWESQQAWETFLKDRLIPALEKAGIQGRPNTEFFQIHRTDVFDVNALNARARGAAAR